MRTILILLLATIGLQSCFGFIKGERGDGNIQSKEFNIEDYSSLHLAGSAKIYYKQKTDEKPYLKIEIDENLMQYLEPRVGENNNLELQTTKNINPTKYVIYTNSTSLQDAGLSGAGKLFLDSDVKTDNLKLSISGSGEIVAGNIECRKLEISVSGSGELRVDTLNADMFGVSIAGSGNVKASGSVRESDVQISGSGDIDISGLASSKAKSGISGMGKIRLMVSDSLEVRVSGIGDVYYKGNPGYKQISSSGLGKVRQE